MAVLADGVTLSDSTDGFTLSDAVTFSFVKARTDNITLSDAEAGGEEFLNNEWGWGDTVWDDDL